MELNFNSVEMSSKPNAEASSLDYAEAPLTFNSVETIPVLKAWAYFKTDSGNMIKEDMDIVPTVIDKSQYYIPQNCVNSIHNDIQHLADELCMFDNVPESITRFFDLWSSSFATRHSPNKFGSALAAHSGDFKAFARELFMSDYDMGDGGHVFRTC